MIRSDSYNPASRIMPRIRGEHEDLNREWLSHSWRRIALVALAAAILVLIFFS